MESTINLQEDRGFHQEFVGQEAQYVPTCRGGKNVFLDRMLFRIKQSNQDGSTSFKCSWKNCPAGLKVMDGNITFVSKKWHIFHPEADIKMSTMKLRAAIIKRSKAEPYESANTIFRLAVGDIDEDLAKKTSPERARIVGLSSHHTRMVSRHKTANRECPPKTIEEIVLQDHHKFYKAPLPPHRLVDFIAADEIGDHNEDRIIIFGTNHNLFKMASCRKLFADGTFKQAPKFFYQLYTIHGYFNGKMFPWIYALLPNKTEATYVRMLNLIPTKLHSLNEDTIFRPDEFQIDFEKGMVKALRSHFGQIVRVKGCTFYLSQSLIRKAGKIGMGRENNEDGTIERKIVRHCMALAFLDPEYIVATFERIAQFIEEEQDLPLDRINKCRQFIEYMRRNYIEASYTSGYPIEMWNHHFAMMDRTNNRVEGWHSGFNPNKIPKPNVYEFIEQILKVQMNNDLEISSLQRGEQVPTTIRHKYVKVNRTIHNLTVELSQGEIDSLPFLHKIESCMLHAAA